MTSNLQKQIQRYSRQVILILSLWSSIPITIPTKIVPDTEIVNTLPINDIFLLQFFKNSTECLVLYGFKIY